jgi:valyl-tRNA synthetase
MQLEKVYEPQRFEPHWAQWWIDSGIFRAVPGRETASGARKVFSLVIPPPNVTGSLHMGHMLEHTEIDVAVRWHRMLGEETLWLPGTDHAGIATQLVVERKLKAEGLDRRQIGREEFERRVWEWKAESGGTIKRQMIRLGTSCDWSRERFTLDPGLSRAVREVFVSLFDKGLIYRGQYIVNWCPRCLTAISDLEVSHTELGSHLWRIRYPVAGTDAYLVVATTRPETMLGDTAVAVNAADPRYTAFHGKMVRLPLTDREIPIILDEIADPKFGTGAVKITPAHDPNDFAAGQRHGLPRIQVIDETGRMGPEAGEFAGLDRFEARTRVVEALAAQGLLDGIEDYTLSVGVCQRCQTVVEPLVSNQWFVKTKPLAEKAIAAVETKAIEIIPENWTKTYNEWMYNIRDWCISRQLWWGHRIPAWYCECCGETIVAREDPSACPVCNSSELRQDPDVLDTWFSSGLWPFSTLGWPEQTDDLKTFYPTTLLITGFDILFFWVARMIMLGLEFMGEVPFRQVYIHGLVRDAERQKMSKTKGNVVDPLVVTQEYGTDAVRMALLSGAAPGSDIVFTKDRLESARAFANKIWNAARFLFVNMERCGVEPWTPEDLARYRPEGDALEDRWIFARLNACAAQVNQAVAAHRFHDVAQTVWHFFWGDFCDWYVELKKLRFREQSGLNPDWRNLLAAFETALRLLHPVMPFLTEELWQRLAPESPSRPLSIALAAFPLFRPDLVDESAERDMSALQAAVTQARNDRAEKKIDPKLNVPATIHASDEFVHLAEQKLAIEKLTAVTVKSVERSATAGTFEIVLEVPEAQRDAQKLRLAKEREDLLAVIANSGRQLSDETFLQKAPARIVDAMRQKLGDYQAQLTKIDAALGGGPAGL